MRPKSPDWSRRLPDETPMRNRTAVPHVTLSLGKIGSLIDGLGEYSTQLGHHVAAAAPLWRERWGVRFHFHLPARWIGLFGDEVGYLPVRPWQSRLNLQPRRHAIWHALNQLGRIPPPPGTRHAVMTVHDLNPIYHDAPDAAGRALDQLRRRLSRFDEVITLTRHVESDIHRHLGWQGPVQVIANGVRDLSQAPRSPVAALQGRPYFLHLSRMARSKNPHLLLDLAALWPDHALVMAGPDGSDSRALEARARERGLDNVIFLRDIDDATKAWLYAGCEAFLFPSQTEGFGLPPLEAMCFGKPVFLSTLTSLPEIGGTAAAYWPELNAAAMDATLRAELPRLRTRAAEIRAHALADRWADCAQACLALYARRLGIEAGAPP